MKLSKYFKREEFACKCGCGQDDIDERLVWILSTIREHFGKPVVITSGLRCANHNAKVGGAQKSQHVLGKAVDFQVKGVDPKVVQKYVDELFAGRYGIGWGKTFTHIDVRDKPARFDY